MTDYSALIDDETWAFIHRTQASYPDDTVSFTIDGQRHVFGAASLRSAVGRDWWLMLLAPDILGGE